MDDSDIYNGYSRLCYGEEYEVILKPRLVESKMLLCFGERVDVGGKTLQSELGKKELPVLEWVGVGLAIHQYHDTIDKRYHWRISHMDSGRSILRYIKSKDEAIDYLMRVREIHKDWTFTEGKFHELPNRSEIAEALLGLQKEISGVRR